MCNCALFYSVILSLHCFGPEHMTLFHYYEFLNKVKKILHLPLFNNSKLNLFSLYVPL